MVKGISKQVILVRPQKDALFEQAIFIVRDGAKPVTEKELLRQAREASQEPTPPKKWLQAAFFCSGAATTGLIWLLTAVF